MSFKLTIGKLAFAGKDLFTNEAIVALNLKPAYQETIDAEYLYWVLQAVPLEKESIFAVKGRTLNTSKLKRIEIPFPELAEQRRIVARIEALLGEVREMRKIQEEIADDAARLMDTAVADMLRLGKENGWDLLSIASVASNTERRNPTHTPDDPFQYVNIGSVENEKGTIDLDKVSTIEGRNAPSRARKVIRTDDVVFATTRPYLRNVALVPETLDDQICTTGFCVIRAKEGKADPRYLFFACRSRPFMEQIIAKQRGASYPAVSDSDVYETKIPVPYPKEPERSLVEQRRIAKYLELLAREVNQFQSLNLTNRKYIAQLKNAILFQAFRGEL